MKLIGCLLCWIFAWIFFRSAKFYSPQTKDYSGYPVAQGTVIAPHDFGGYRWMVSFKGANGYEVIGADDILCVKPYHSELCTIPKENSVESFYYWEHGHKYTRYGINGRPVLYHIHFCNEDFYQHTKESYHRNKMFFLFLSALLFLLGILVLTKSL